VYGNNYLKTFNFFWGLLSWNLRKKHVGLENIFFSFQCDRDNGPLELGL